MPPHPRSRAGRRIVGLCVAVLLAGSAGPRGARAEQAAPPRVITHQSYVEDVLKPTRLPLADTRAMFGVVFESLAARVKVYPTENYYYFGFVHGGVRYAGNIRLDAKDRDVGKVHFAFFEDLAEWREEPPMNYVVLDRRHGVTLEKLERFVYRMSHGGKSVVFELNDLSAVVPPAHALASDETFIGPIFDDSAVRFFLVFNRRLKAFHYVLDETVPPTEEFLAMRQTGRVLIGKRTGFAYYRDHKRDRKILIGVFEGNARVNNAFDGPFDQLPDNFLKGDELRDAIIAVEPSMKGRIDRFGGLADGSGRFLIGPYAYYRGEDDLLPFHTCATDTRIPADDYYGCFAMDWSGSGELTAVRRLNAATAAKLRKPAKRKAKAASP